MEGAGAGGNTFNRNAAFVTTDCLNGPLLLGLSRDDIDDNHKRFFPAFEGES